MILLEHPHIDKTLKQDRWKVKEFLAFENRSATDETNRQLQILCIFM